MEELFGPQEEQSVHLTDLIRIGRGGEDDIIVLDLTLLGLCATLV